MVMMSAHSLPREYVCFLIFFLIKNKTVSRSVWLFLVSFLSCLVKAKCSLEQQAAGT